MVQRNWLFQRIQDFSRFIVDSPWEAAIADSLGRKAAIAPHS